ncbi:multidrug resistance-associated protein 4 isoform X1 [Trichogramma pretiosum]|uniref:multidrug resistance-associated protein 4 isoform X1 n=2 Tax=Trichogramma pretiosum TaxID=7493 RepID=UPI000C71A804|nr:multidrug resistance-associated protein 4 isoform X1 [Trichogramma pretiosum]
MCRFPPATIVVVVSVQSRTSWESSSCPVAVLLAAGRACKCACIPRQLAIAAEANSKDGSSSSSDVMYQARKSRVENPRQSAGRLSVLTFAWLFKTFIRGFRRELKLSDLYYPLDEHSSHNVGERLSAEWSRRQQRDPSEASLLRCIFSCFGREIVLVGLVQAFLEFSIRLSRPYILLQLLNYLSEKQLQQQQQQRSEGSDSQGMAKSEAYAWAGALALGVFVDCCVAHLCVQSLMHMGMKIRVACCSLVYRKILRVPLSFAANDRDNGAGTNLGQVLNLLSNDASRIDNAVYYLHYIWISPLQALVVFYFLYREVHLAACTGIALQVLFIPLLGFFGRITNRLTSKYTTRTDERLRLTNEIIKGIRAIKMYAWEKPFSLLVDRIRKKEMHVVKQESIVTDMSLASEFYIPRLCVFITILAYVLLDNSANAEKVYFVAAFYDVLRMSMYTLFPMCLHDVAEAMVSLKRLQKFMLIEELPPQPALQNLGTGINDDTNEANNSSIIVFKNYSANWSEKHKVLSGIDLEIERGSLIAIVGQVGSGKSSLLHAILREIPQLASNAGSNLGEVRVLGSCSYGPQEPWIFASSVRQNILFGRPYEQARYDRVLGACQLRKDLEGLPHGDETLLGEKGINLSGGQCARVSLARAVYRDADIYLLDDPLSAVDAVVGRDIFYQCIRELLKFKTVVLVTHQFQHLEKVDQIVVLDSGSIKAVGTLAELQDKGINLIQMMQSSNSGDFDESKESSSKPARTKSTTIEPEKETVVTANGKVAEKQHRQQQQTEEKKVEGSISATTYLAYFMSSRNIPLVVMVFVASLAHQLAASGGDYFLAIWVNKEEEYASSNGSLTDYNNNNNASGGIDRDWYIGVYGGITCATIVLCLLQSWTFFEMSMRIANNLHANMFSSVISTTIEFFSANPLGRIMNRFSKDMSIVDMEVSRAMIDVIQNAIHILAAFVVVTSVNFYLIVPAALCFCCFYTFSLFFIKTSRSVKRLEGLTRSPVYGHISDSIRGLTTIRALRAQSVLVDEFDDHQDLHSAAWFIFFSGSRGLGMYLDVFCSCFLTCVLFTLLAFDARTLAGDVGLAITQCMMLLNTLQWGVRQFAELENQMTSVERVLEYSKLPSEAESLDGYNSSAKKRNGTTTTTALSEIGAEETTALTEIKLQTKVPTDWPSRGQIEFKNVTLRYEKRGATILKGLDFTIEGCEKIGIVGRTGAGKSSLINSLFRLGYVEGDILIDDVPTSQLELLTLRSKISIIPQEPILFEGSLRKNLDPFGECSDASLWQALDDVGMKWSLDGLEAWVAEGGSNFSVGQRQLLCLARAIVRRNRILVLDEATANVDPCTDELIQKTVKKKFEDCTILTIAHRLHTVIDSDRIMVIDEGTVAEFDHPHILLTKKKGFLYDNVQQSGAASAQVLMKIAKLNYDKKLRKI